MVRVIKKLVRKLTMYMIRVIKKLVRKLTMYPTAEHTAHKGCIHIFDSEDMENITANCCGECACCPCHSWQCGVCLWQEKPVFRSICEWAWVGRV